FADTCVFAKQSLGPILCDPPRLRWLAPLPSTGSPSPEVTGTFCRVPSPQITRAPEATRLAYVCPFAVRSHAPLPAEAFLGSRLHKTPEVRRLPLASALDYPGLLPPGNVYRVAPGLPPPGSRFAPESPLRVITQHMWFRNIHLIPIVCAL